MKYVMNRDFVVQGLGHALRFEKDKPINVPPRLEAEVRKYGGVLAEGETPPAPVELPKEGFDTPREEPQGDKRLDMLLQACDVFVGENDNRKFGANGAPKVIAFFDLLHFRIDATERNNVWAMYNQRRADAANPSNLNEEAPPEIPDEDE